MLGIGSPNDGRFGSFMQHLSSFLDVLHRSGLVASTVVETALQEYKSENDPATVDGFSDGLVERGILTPWQVGHLLQGKYKGFMVGQHKILSVIGRGGHATVYLAEHLTLRQSRVIKVLSRSKLGKETSLQERFVREAQATSSFNHPNIIRCLDVAISQKMSYIVMEYHKGSDLEKLVKKEGPLGFAKSIDVMLQTIEGLEYINKAGMIHRDIKPSNLLLTEQGVVKILDLGLARIAMTQEVDASLTQTYEDNLGTTDYVAPEQAVDSHTVDFRADIYSLGCTLYHLITGRPPFHQGTIVQRLAKHQTQMPDPVLEIRPDCPKPLAAICWKMIQKAPEDRYQSYPELATALSSLLKKPVRVGGGGGSSRFNNQLAKSTSISNVPPPAGSPSPESTIDTAPIASADEPTLVAPSTVNEIQTEPFDSSQSQLPVAIQPTPIRTSLDQGSEGPALTQFEENALKILRRQERSKIIWGLAGLILGIGIALASILVWESFHNPDQYELPKSVRSSDQ
ncbi:MAG: protein kinase [Planctomycetota bacterium]